MVFFFFFPKFLGVETRGSVISIIEALSWLLERAVGGHYLLGFTVGCLSYNVITISYLLFADNMSIFFEVNYEQMWDLITVCVCVFTSSLWSKDKIGKIQAGFSR